MPLQRCKPNLSKPTRKQLKPHPLANLSVKDQFAHLIEYYGDDGVLDLQNSSLPRRFTKRIGRMKKEAGLHVQPWATLKERKMLIKMSERGSQWSTGRLVSQRWLVKQLSIHSICFGCVLWTLVEKGFAPEGLHTQCSDHHFTSRKRAARPWRLCHENCRTDILDKLWQYVEQQQGFHQAVQQALACPVASLPCTKSWKEKKELYWRDEGEENGKLVISLRYMQHWLTQSFLRKVKMVLWCAWN